MNEEEKVRQPAVAGYFYPAIKGELERTLHEMLHAAGEEMGINGDAGKGAPKVLIAPHAGYMYSGPIAASAYVRLKEMASQIKRVVMIGPSHRVGFEGVALPSVQDFLTPLGRVPLDRAVIDEIIEKGNLQAMDVAHRDEHSLEVHLPFLQTVLKDFHLVPILAGKAEPELVAELLLELWGGEETLIVCSSDLSHYLEYSQARELDQKTSEAILNYRPADIRYENACGGAALKGTLMASQQKGLTPQLLDLRNSGDICGDRLKVVGYGAYAFYAA